MTPETAIHIREADPIVFSPALRAADELANYWMRQATHRLRREVAWLWHERGLGRPPQPGELPPLVESASESLDLSRHWAEKRQFFSSDITARYLTEKITETRPDISEVKRGSFSWVINELELDDVSIFLLALGLTSAFDASCGAVIGTCLNDHNLVFPNLALVQRLWDTPEEVLSLCDPMHPLYSLGLLNFTWQNRQQPVESFWRQPLTIPSMVAQLLLSGAPVLPAGMVRIIADDEDRNELSETNKIISFRLMAEPKTRLRIVPLLGTRHSPYRQTAVEISRLTKRTLWEYHGDPTLLSREEYLNMLATLAWLQDIDILISCELFAGRETHLERNRGLPLTTIPVTMYLAITERHHTSHIDHGLLLPFVTIPGIGYQQRLAAWRKGFIGETEKYESIFPEMARRFRYEEKTIQKICEELRIMPQNPTADDFTAACRAELSVDIGELASYVEPRFFDEQLILPKKQAIQFEEQLVAMQELTRVHYSWGTAQAWNESGITVLFAGPPGTGKTMAAEIMAHQLKLPMYRIDLSQVVNKYIGETEKNLKRVFDAADISDMVLFFDEADSLFGKRIEASDARDRYANLEISYLLERMERFKGLAILATNRKSDLDQAFLRRIRHIIDFPMPDEKQRAAIWRQVIPDKVAKNSQIDFAFLARQFPLSGGHIRSVAFNACLQSAHASKERKELYMKDVLVAVKREYDKMNRSLSLEQMGEYAEHIAQLG